MLSKQERYKLVDDIFSNEKFLVEAAKTLYGSADEAYELTKRELQIILSDASDYEVERLKNICESARGAKDYNNNYDSAKIRRHASDYDGDDFPNGAQGNIQRNQRRAKSKGDNPLVKDWEDE